MPESEPPLCQVIPSCPLCGGKMELVYDRPNSKVCVCVDCHTGVTVPGHTWAMVLERGFVPGEGRSGRAAAMDVYSVVIACPNTGKATRTGHEVDDISQFKFVGLLQETVQCEHCPEAHTWSQKDAWPVARQNASRVRVPAAWTKKPAD